MVDAVGTTKYTYTAGNQLWTEDDPFASDTVTNTYVNRLRAALALQQPSGVWTNAFAYDAARRLTNVVSPAGSFTNEYSPGVPGASGFASSLVKRLRLANGSAITNSFDSVGRLLATHLRTSAGALTNKHEYLYNPAGQRTNQTYIDASTVAYRYDNIGQLKVADSSVAAEDRGYAYDAAWNLNYRTNDGSLGSLTVDVKNQLVTADGNNCNYDANGNLTNYAWIGYAYDDESRLSSVSDGAYHNYRSDFVYGGSGRLRKRLDYAWGIPPESSPEFGGRASPLGGGSRWYLTNTCLYLYDGWRVIQERDANNTPTVSYTRGIDLSGTMEGAGLPATASATAGGIGGLLARSTGNGTTWTSHAYYHADGNGNITCMLDSSQGLAARYLYDPFGDTISSSGTLADANVYRFSSKEFHPASGLYYYGYRWYSPSLQRWPNRDPLGGYPDVELKTARGRIYKLNPWELYEGSNLYTYAYNDPINLADINGLWTIGIGGRAGYGFFFAGDISLGFYFGHSKENGWNFGFLESTFVGAGGPPNMSAGFFAQWTNAKCVG